MTQRREQMAFALAVVLIVYIIWLKPIYNLSTDGWVLYYSPQCHHCIDQIKSIGASRMWVINTVNSEKDPDECKKQKITAYPTWINHTSGQVFMGNASSGEKSISETLATSVAPN